MFGGSSPFEGPFTSCLAFHSGPGPFSVLVLFSLIFFVLPLPQLIPAGKGLAGENQRLESQVPGVMVAS